MWYPKARLTIKTAPSPTSLSLSIWGQGAHREGAEGPAAAMIYTYSQAPPRPIVYPGDNIDKGPSLVGCLHQSVTMETPRETIPEPSLSFPTPHTHPAAVSQPPAGEELLVIATTNPPPPPSYCHLQMGHSWITLKSPPPAELTLLKGL